MRTLVPPTGYPPVFIRDLRGLLDSRQPSSCECPMRLFGQLASGRSYPVMNRRTFVCGLMLGTLSTPLAAEAQPAAKSVRVAVLSPGPGPASSWSVLEAFRQRLQELGHVEGRNLTIEWRFIAGNIGRLPEVVAELVRLDVDVIVPINTLAAQATKQATAKIPIVFVQVADLAGSDLVPSLARPGGNVIGLVSNTRELSGKRLELLKEALPRVTTIGILRDANPTTELIFRDMDVASHQLGLRLTDLAIRSRDELQRAIEDGAKHHVGTLFVIDGVTIAAAPVPILQRAAGSA